MMDVRQSVVVGNFEPAAGHNLATKLLLLWHLPAVKITCAVVAVAGLSGAVSYAALQSHKPPSAAPPAPVAATKAVAAPTSNGGGAPAAPNTATGTASAAASTSSTATSTPASSPKTTTKTSSSSSTTSSSSGSSSTSISTSSGSSGGGTSSGGSSGGGSTSLQPSGMSGSWTLAFDDEFNGSGINTGTWNTESGYCKNGSKVSTGNESESGGNLILTFTSASGLTCNGSSVTGYGAEISSWSNILPVGGFAEARVSFPGSGSSVYNWPAWWTSGPNWPTAGEADIFEGLGPATTNYHYYSGGNKQAGPFTIGGTWTNAYHTYGLYRGNGYNNVYWDGSLVKTYTTSDNGQNEALIFTNGCYSSCTSGAQVYVDYVRVWD